MPKDSSPERESSAPVFLAWGMPSVEAHEGFFDNMAMWVSGGVSLLVWTAIALILTAS